MLAAGTLAALVGAGCAAITNVSIDSAGGPGSANSSNPDLSGDGRLIVFQSSASNLVAGDTNSANDVFLRDTATGVTRRVSVDSTGAQANSSSDLPAISADGRYIGFQSDASNLVADDTNGTTDAFVHDTLTGTTRRVSIATDGAQSDDFAFSPVLSANGRYAAFQSYAGNLVAGDTNSSYDVFVHDLVTATTTRISVDSNGNETSGDSGTPAISDNGRYIAFRSGASNVVADDTNGRPDIFVHDTATAVTSRVSVDSSESQSEGGAPTDPAISADGRFITFRSDASDLVPDDTNGAYDVFVRDTVAGTTAWVSVDSDEAEANDWSYSSTISGDGRFIAFWSDASNLVAGDTNTTNDVFVRDTASGTTTRASVDFFGRQADGESRDVAVSADGTAVAFGSCALNLTDTAGNGFASDVFVRANPVPTVASIAPGVVTRGSTTAITVTGSGFVADTTLSIDGTGISVSDVDVLSATQLSANVTVTSGAAVGKRSVFLRSVSGGPLGGAIGVCGKCVTVD